MNYLKPTAFPVPKVLYIALIGVVILVLLTGLVVQAEELGTLKWKFETGSTVFSSPAIAKDGTVYVGSYDNHLYAFSPDGTLKWKYEFGDKVRSSPAITKDGTVYVGSDDNHLYALNPDGNIKWKYETGGDIKSSPAISKDGTVYFGSRDGYLYALNPDSTLKWKYEIGSIVDSSPAIAKDGTLFVGSGDNHLYALNPEGTLKWKYETGDAIDSSPAIAEDGTVYFGSDDNHLYALNPDGTLRWKYETGGLIFSSPAIAEDGTVYFGSYDGHMYALNPNGDLKWEYQTGGWSSVDSSPAIAEDGTVYFGSGMRDRHLYAIEPEGTLKWKYETGGDIRSSPAIAEDGTVYFGSYDGHMYAINRSSKGLAKSPWAMFAHNLRHTSRAGTKKVTNAELTVKVVDKTGADLDARLYLDGKYQGDTGWDGEYTASDLSPDSYRVRVEKDGYASNSVTTHLTSEEKEELPLTLRKKNKEPNASFFYTPSDLRTGQEIDFNSDSTDPDGSVDKHHWSFGDDSTSRRKNPTHKYSQPGTYTVKLEVTDDEGATDTTYEEVNVREFNAELTVKVTDNSGSTLDARVYLDGEYEGATGRDGQYTVSDISSGTYKVKVEKEGYYSDSVTNVISPGEIEELPLTLKEKNKPPTAKFTYSPKQPTTGQQLTFDGSSSSDPDGTMETYKWNLAGNGDTDKFGSEVTHIYDEEGTYEVSLTVTDDYGDSASTTQEVTVTQQQKEEVTIDEKHALVVGVTDYEYDGLNNLNFPAEDAKAFHDLLIEEGGFKEENVTLLTNEEATTYRFDTELRKLATETESDDLAVIYYSGHGVQGKDAKPLDEEDGYDEYYVTYDTEPTNSDTIYETGYRDDIFANSVSNIPSDQIAIFLDSCYAGGATKTVKGYTLEGQKDFPTNNDVFSDFDDLEGTALFAASKEDQRSYEPNTEELKEKLGHGVFTYYLLQGLRGEADKDNDGTITIEELRSYVTPSVEEFTEENFPTPQTPKVKGAIDAPLVQREGSLVGKVASVVGDNEKARQGDYVMLNLGSQEGVKRNDQFRVYLSTKAVEVVEDVQGDIEVLEVVGPHLSFAEVSEADFVVEAGYKVEEISEE